MTIMGCYHDLKARVTKLELVLPAVEKSLLSEASHLRFIYSPGMYVCMMNNTNLVLFLPPQQHPNSWQSKQIDTCTVHVCVVCSDSTWHGLHVHSSPWWHSRTTACKVFNVSDWVDSRVSICICCWDVVIGAEWHASLPSDENHFMKRDLPRFLHNLYDDCRGPPRLFLLDKYGPLNPFDKSSSFKAFMLFSLKRSDSYTDWTSSCCDDLPPSTLLALLSRQRELGQTHDFWHILNI